MGLGAYLFGMAGGLYWLFNAPDLRFGYGWVMLLIGLPLAGLMSGGAEKLSGKKYSGNALLTAGLLDGAALVSGGFV